MHTNMNHCANFLKITLVMFLLLMILPSCLETKECTLPLSIIKEVRNTFKNMSPYDRNPPNDSCNTSVLDDGIYYIPVEDAAIVIIEAGYEITKFLGLHHRGLGYKEEECNRLMGILFDYTNIMAGCVPAESSNHPLREPFKDYFKDYFKKLDTLLGKENFTECTKLKSTVGIEETLILISHLNSRIRANSSTI